MSRIGVRHVRTAFPGDGAGALLLQNRGVPSRIGCNARAGPPEHPRGDNPYRERLSETIESGHVSSRANVRTASRPTWQRRDMTSRVSAIPVLTTAIAPRRRTGIARAVSDEVCFARDLLRHALKISLQLRADQREKDLISIADVPTVELLHPRAHTEGGERRCGILWVSYSERRVSFRLVRGRPRSSPNASPPSISRLATCRSPTR